ncbi:hypothetical protein ACS0TY_026904 [Phlomoides rotata]
MYTMMFSICYDVSVLPSVIDDRRASMTLETVQMLFCGNDWIRNVYGIKTRPRDSLDVAESSTYQEVELPNQD